MQAHPLHAPPAVFQPSHITLYCRQIEKHCHPSWNFRVKHAHTSLTRPSQYLPVSWTKACTACSLAPLACVSFALPKAWLTLLTACCNSAACKAEAQDCIANSDTHAMLRDCTMLADSNPYKQPASHLRRGEGPARLGHRHLHRRLRHSLRCHALRLLQRIPEEACCCGARNEGGHPDSATSD